MATIDQRGERSWRARVRLPGYKLKTRTFDTRAQAEVWAERIERELHIGNDTIPNLAAEQGWLRVARRMAQCQGRRSPPHAHDPAQPGALK